MSGDATHKQQQHNVRTKESLTDIGTANEVIPIVYPQKVASSTRRLFPCRDVGKEGWSD
jgi:hypothetical protein